MQKRLHAFVCGRVQGVWYRASTQKTAQKLGLNGWVRNLPDGRVELVAEGDEQALQQLLNWCWQGPTLAQVSDIQHEWSHATHVFNDFCAQRL